MSWQEIIVAIIGLVCLLIVVRHVWSFFRPSRKPGNPCANCSAGCDLKRMLEEKQRECALKDKNESKKCCK